MAVGSWGLVTWGCRWVAAFGEAGERVAGLDVDAKRSRRSLQASPRWRILRHSASSAAGLHSRHRELRGPCVGGGGDRCVPTPLFEDHEPDLGQLCWLRVRARPGATAWSAGGAVMVPALAHHPRPRRARFAPRRDAVRPDGKSAAPTSRDEAWAIRTAWRWRDRLKKFRFAGGPSFAMTLLAWGTLVTRAQSRRRDE